MAGRPRHGVDVGADARADHAPLDAVERLRAIAVPAPDQVLGGDAQRGEDPLGQQPVEVPPVGPGEAVGQPVRVAVAGVPAGAGPEQEPAEAAGLLEPGRLRRQLADRDPVQPAGPGIVLLRDAEARVVPACPVLASGRKARVGTCVSEEVQPGEGLPRALAESAEDERRSH